MHKSLDYNAHLIFMSNQVPKYHIYKIKKITSVNDLLKSRRKKKEFSNFLKLSIKTIYINSWKICFQNITVIIQDL